MNQPYSEEYIQVTTTCDKRDAAERIAQALVEKKLAACVQVIGPITSIYRWQGKIEQAEEWICFIKSTKKIYPELERAITAIHPYDTPEIIAVPITAGSSKYLHWLSETVHAE
jgi:periplasmic divalent cation tolerance protein